MLGMGLFGDRGGLFGGHVPVALGQVFVLFEVGRLANEEFGILGHFDGIRAREGVDDNRKDIPDPDVAYIFESDDFAAYFYFALLA